MAAGGTPQPNDDYIKLLDEQDSNINSGDGKDHPEHTYTVTEYKAINDTLDDSVTPPEYREAEAVNPTSSWSRIIPIFKRSICNDTGVNVEDYNEMFLESVDSPSITSYFDYFTTNNFSSSKFKKHARKTGSQTDHFVYIIPSNNTLQIKNKDTFKQLANYGEPKSAPTIITDLVTNNDYIGTKERVIN